jgi:DNA-binding transcriptional MerR regulator
MTLQEFINKWDGKPCEIGGSANAINQCVDLANAYITEVFNQPAIFWTNAVDFPEKLDRNIYEWTENTPDGIAPSGAVVVFKQYGSRYGTPGHIAVTLDGCTNSTLNLFEQNYPTGSYCKKASRNYLGCRGWFTLKKSANMYEGLDLDNKESMKACVDVWKKLQDGKYISIDEHNKVINELDSKSTEQANQYAKDKQILEEKVRTLEEIIKQLQDTEHSWSDTADKLERKLSAIISELQKVGVSISIESDVNSMASTVSSYISTLQNGAKDFLEVSEALKIANKKIEQLSKKETAFRTVNLGSIIIKFYHK